MKPSSWFSPASTGLASATGHAGDQLRIEVDVLNWRPLAAKLLGKAFVEGKLACEATIMCAVVPRPGKIVLE